MSELKTVDIKGKQYVEVSERIRYFREHFKDGRIITNIVSIENGVCVFKAEIFDKNNLIATGHAYEKEGSSFINKTSYIENCETSAIGRALGIAGIGIEGSVRSALEMQNAMNNQPIYKTFSKQSDEDKKAYWEEFRDICMQLDVEPKEFLTEWANIDMDNKATVGNTIVKYLKDQEMFAEQIMNFKDNKAK